MVYIMKKFLLAGLFVSVIFPGFVTAQSDIDPSGGVVSSCINLSNNMRYRMRDISVNGEVSTLQDFLQTRGYLNSEPTGFFGILTLKAVKDFQSANGISPTGYVGPITRAKIRELSCQGAVVPQPIPPQPIYPPSCASLSGFSTVTGQPCGGSTLLPYVTSATNVAIPTDIVTVTGGRFHPTSNTVNVNGVLRVLPSSNNGTVINFSIADFGLSALILYRFDVHTSEGGSNVWTFQVGPTVPSIFSYGISTVGTLSVLQGASVATSVNLYLVSGTPQPVALAVSGLPYGVTGSFSSPSCTPTCSSTLTLTAGASVTPGTYTLTVFAVGGGITRTSTFGLVVSAPAPTLTVLSPNGGEKWEVGKTYSITWKSNGLDQVNINLLSADPVNEGSYRISRLVSNLSASM